jgi:anti-sigma B factor antagonist
LIAYRYGVLTFNTGNDGTIAVVGRFGAAESPAAQSFLDRMQGPVTLDCSQLEYISSAGLGVLLKTQKRLAHSNARVRLVSVRPNLLEIFRFSGFDRIFDIEPAAAA